MGWRDLGDWWRSELLTDSAYEEIVTPLLLDVLQPSQGHLYLDLGCGEGRVMRALAASGSESHGLDVNFDLVVNVACAVVGELPAIPLRDAIYDGVYSVLSLEHVSDAATFFLEARRVTKPTGLLVLVMNHPFWTAPESTPITDSDGEILWRPGAYFDSGSTDLAAGDDSVTFFHRSMADLLNAAADAGWTLEHVVELPHHDLTEQAGIPRLLACRWRSR